LELLAKLAIGSGTSIGSVSVKKKRNVIERVQWPTSSYSIKPSQDSVNKWELLQSPLVDPKRVTHCLNATVCAVRSLIKGALLIRL